MLNRKLTLANSSFALVNVGLSDADAFPQITVNAIRLCAWMFVVGK